MTQKQKVIECDSCMMEITKKSFADAECVCVTDDGKVFCSTNCYENSLNYPKTFEDMLDLVGEW